jgi:preprotein translocase subunit SecG
MFAFIIAVHVIVSIFLIFVILLQPGKSDGMAAFSGGGAGSQTVFGGRGSVTFLSKVTTGCAIVFMCTSLTLAWRSSHSDSVLRARRNIAAADAAKKTETPLKAPEPTTQTAPPAATGGAAIPVPAAPAGNAPAAPAATKPLPAPAAQPKK